MGPWKWRNEQNCLLPSHVHKQDKDHELAAKEHRATKEKQFISNYFVSAPIVCRPALAPDRSGAKLQEHWLWSVRDWRSLVPNHLAQRCSGESIRQPVFGKSAHNSKIVTAGRLRLLQAGND